MITPVRKEFRKLVTWDVARRIIKDLDIKPDSQDVDIENAFGHILADDVVSGVDVPPFMRASMDVRNIFFEELINSIKGYHTEAKTHSAVAAVVKLGKADACVGIRTAELNGLKFIKIADEEYDFVVPERLIGSTQIRKFLESLKSREFKEKLPHGLNIYERTGEIVSANIISFKS
ncbi:MAG TPA: substrate-binding domain-containing protein [Candidatus Methanoperedens sp.]|jgi:molybdate-binding protein